MRLLREFKRWPSSCTCSCSGAAALPDASVLQHTSVGAQEEKLLLRLRSRTLVSVEARAATASAFPLAHLLLFLILLLLPSRVCLLLLPLLILLLLLVVCGNEEGPGDLLGNSVPHDRVKGPTARPRPCRRSQLLQVALDLVRLAFHGRPNHVIQGLEQLRPDAAAEPL